MKEPSQIRCGVCGKIGHPPFGTYSYSTLTGEVQWAICFECEEKSNGYKERKKLEAIAKGRFYDKNPKFKPKD